MGVYEETKVYVVIFMQVFESAWRYQVDEVAPRELMPSELNHPSKYENHPVSKISDIP